MDILVRVKGVIEFFHKVKIIWSFVDSGVAEGRLIAGPEGGFALEATGANGGWNNWRATDVRWSGHTSAEISQLRLRNWDGGYFGAVSSLHLDRDGFRNLQ